MTGKIAAGVIAGRLTATALIGIVAVAYNAGQNDDGTVQVVDAGETATRVVEVGRDWHGPGVFGLIVPVLLIVLVVALVTRHRRWRNGYGCGSGSWCGPGAWGPGPCGPPPSGASAPARRGTTTSAGRAATELFA